MKYSLLFLLIVLAEFTSVSAQKTVELFGIKLGSSFAQCEKVIKSKGGKIAIKSIKDSYFYEGGVVIGKDTALTVSLEFHKKKLYHFEITFAPEVSIYDTIKHTLITKYGKITSEQYSFSSPYKIGDGKEKEAILAHKSSIWSYWRDTETVSPDTPIELNIKRHTFDNGTPFALLELKCTDDNLAP